MIPKLAATLFLLVLICKYVIFNFKAWFDYFLIILVKVKYFLKFNSDPKTGSNFIFVSFNLQTRDL